MATGYVITGSQGRPTVKTYDTNGFTFANTIKFSTGPTSQVFTAYFESSINYCLTEGKSGVKSGNVGALVDIGNGYRQYLPYAGSVSTFNFHTVSVEAATVPRQYTGGTITGGGSFDSGAQINITVTPKSGYITSSVTGYSGVVPPHGAFTFQITVDGDKTITATFQKVYNVVFNANGGTGAPTTLADCHYEETYLIPSETPSRQGYTFLGWARKNNASSPDFTVGSDFSKLTTSASITLYAVWKQYKLSYDTDGGTPSSIAPFKGAVGDTTTLPSSDEVTKSQYVLSAWRINGVDYPQGSPYSLTQANLTAVAQWRRPTIHFTNGDTTKGSASLYDVTSARTVATERDGALSFDGIVGHTYQVVFSATDMFYWCPGVTVGTSTINQFTLSQIDIDSQKYENGTYSWQKLPTFAIEIAPDAEKLASCVIERKLSDGTWTDEPDETSLGGSPRWLPGQVRFVVTPTPAYELFSVNIKVGEDSAGQTEEDISSPYEYVVGTFGDVYVAFGFKDKEFDVTVSVDEASSSYGVAKVDGNAEGVEGVKYGETVEYTATLKPNVSSSDYQFEGWYDSDGNKIAGAGTTYTPTITEPLALTAKFAARVNLSLASYDNRTETMVPVVDGSSSISIDGTDQGQGFDAFFALGSTFAYEIFPGAFDIDGYAGTWKFNAWFRTETPQTFDNPVAMQMVGSVAVTETISRVARLTSELITNALSVGIFANPIESGQQGIDVPRGDDMTRITSTVTPAPDDETNYKFVFVGTQTVQVVAKPSITIEQNSEQRTISFHHFATDRSNDPQTIISRDNTYTTLISSSRTIYAIYGEPGNVTTTVAYSSDANSSRQTGIIGIGGKSNDESKEPTVSDEAKQGEMIMLSARALNGYRFVGWFTMDPPQGVPQYLLASAEVPVTSERTLYAKFERDAHAIYEWEGSNENKVFTWRSKRYNANRPVTVSSVHVYADGYEAGLPSLRIDTFQSPNTNDGKSVLLAAKSQDGFRVSMRTPMKYVELEVKANVQVTRIAAATSMGGLTQ